MLRAVAEGFWVSTSVSNKMGQCNFLGQRDRSSFINKGKVGQAQNLAKRQVGLGQLVKIRDEMWDGTVPYFVRAEKDVMK